jgi:hypothetical protein
MSPRRIWCQYELNWFDTNEFDNREDVGRVHVRRLSDGAPPHTVTGLIVRSFWANATPLDDAADKQAEQVHKR